MGGGLTFGFTQQLDGEQLRREMETGGDPSAAVASAEDAHWTLGHTLEYLLLCRQQEK
jgi:hypothetical protein